MLFECLEVENDRNWFFCGFNDTPFDEAVYTSNHLLQAPDASMAITNDVPALAPWHPGSSCLVTSRHFSDYFSGDDNGLTSYSDHLVGSPITSTVQTLSYGIAGWKPSLSYPCPRCWYADWRGACNRVNIEHVIDMETRNNADFPCYTEARKTKVAHRILTNQERLNAMRGVESCDPNKPVCPDEVFRGEDGKYKSFRLFRPGDDFFHVHNGREECKPNEKIFNGGFHCFGCAKTYSCVRTLAKEPTFPFYSEDINQSTDYNAFMLTIDWEVKMAWKFLCHTCTNGCRKNTSAF